MENPKIRYSTFASGVAEFGMKVITGQVQKYVTRVKIIPETYIVLQHPA